MIEKGKDINGWVEWKDKDGKTLDELYRKYFYPLTSDNTKLSESNLDLKEVDAYVA